MSTLIIFAIAVIIVVCIFRAQSSAAESLSFTGESESTRSALVPVRGQLVANVPIDDVVHRNRALPCREWFSPQALIKGERYLVAITGTVSYRTSYGLCKANAFYCAHYDGNFVEKHDCLEFDMRPLVYAKSKIISQDRELHRFVIEWTGSGEKLGIIFKSHYCYLHQKGRCGRIANTSEERGFLIIEIQLAPKQQALPGPSAEERAARVRALSEWLRNWADPKFRRDYAERKGSELLQKRDLVIEEYRKLLEDAELLDWIKKNDPELGRRLTGRLETFLLAERLDVMEPGTKRSRRTKVNGQGNRKKPSPEEYRERAVRWELTKVEDRSAILSALIEAQLEARAKARLVLDRYDLDPDEREQWEREIHRILGEDDDKDRQAMGAKERR